MKLFRILLRGMTSTVFGTQTAYGCPYVVAEDMDSAYKMVKDYLEKKSLGFSGDRVLGKIELLAEEGDYPGCKVQLFLPSEITR